MIEKEILEILEIRLSRIENIVYGTKDRTSIGLISLDILSFINFIKTEINNLVKESEVLKKMMYFRMLYITGCTLVLTSIVDNYSFLLEEGFFFSFKPYNTAFQSEKIQVIFSNLSLYNTVLSQLLSIRELSIPDSNIYLQVASNISQLHIIFMSIESVEIHLSCLSKRIAKILELWYEVGINSVNDCFLEWDKRINNLNSKLQT
ncbi:hypothetical protein PCK1_000756 [Pneumocystis canis]|nr:hypothetical protein PCK1_000756 [Pneumocystis canis]